MQIGPNKLLSFLPGSTQPPAARTGDTGGTTAAAATAATAATSSVDMLRETTPAQEDAGVILAIQSETPGTSTAVAAGDLVYSNVRKSPVATDDSSDTERMAAQHRQALERMVGSSSLSVDKDGVLVAEPASAEEVKARQFVHFAVGAMREYADQQDRLKSATAAQEHDAAHAASLIPRSLVEVQKLAARFRLFA